jgi:hypothetical protein
VTDFRPVDLAAQQVLQLQATRWAVVWWVDAQRRESHFDDRALAEAYAAAHHGLIVPLAALVPWPTRP